ncbi:MAG: hypothetical protein HS099_03430 [Ardenticatenaceae bacterium]|nr:hypothetical protein [Ardenticatenaceae bacterium]
MRKKAFLSFTIMFLFLMVWLLLVIVLLELPVNRPETEWATITNTQYNFTVDYPTKWVARTYGEHGFKGARTVKLRIYRSLLGYFEIAVYRQSATEPTLQDVITWGDARISNLNRNLVSRGEATYEKFPVSYDTINGYEVGRRIYKRDGVTNEDVYIARSKDMIIIRLQSEEEDFEKYVEDFEQIVQSFRPME